MSCSYRLFYRGLCGNCVPEFGFRVGCVFRFKAAWESTTRNPASEWDALPFCGLWRKLHPRSRAQNGIHFPVEASNGKCIPVFCKKRDALSGACLRRAYTSRRTIPSPPVPRYSSHFRVTLQTVRSPVCMRGYTQIDRYVMQERCGLSPYDSKGGSDGEDTRR